jgi:hypothetical protein
MRASSGADWTGGLDWTGEVGLLDFELLGVGVIGDRGCEWALEDADVDERRDSVIGEILCGRGGISLGAGGSGSSCTLVGSATTLGGMRILILSPVRTGGGGAS